MVVDIRRCEHDLARVQPIASVVVVISEHAGIIGNDDLGAGGRGAVRLANRQDCMRTPGTGRFIASRTRNRSDGAVPANNSVH